MENIHTPILNIDETYDKHGNYVKTSRKRRLQKRKRRKRRKKIDKSKRNRMLKTDEKFTSCF